MGRKKAVLCLNLGKMAVHNKIQYLADEFYKIYPEEKFGLFIGLVKKRGEDWAFLQLSEIKEYKNEKNKLRPIKFLMGKKKNGSK